MGDREQTLLAGVSGARLMEYTREIARRERLSGTEDERRAFAYVQEVLDGFGIPTRMYTHDAYISLPLDATLQVVGGQPIECYTTSFGTSTDGIEAEVVYCGHGTAADFAGKDVRGKIALMDGLPAAGKSIEADRAGVAGQIHTGDDHLHWMIISPVWGNPSPERVGLLPRSPAVCIRRSDGAALKEALAPGRPVRVRLRTRVDTGWRKTPLLVADIPGNSDDFVLFSGHLDSWAYGAMDNGTANATMIEVARLLWDARHLLRRGVRLAFWSGHSHGRYSGSAWYADNHWEELHRHCACHVNVDSVGARGANVLTESVVMAETRALARDVIGEQSGQEFHGKRIGRMGDQSFLGIGVPSMFMGMSEQPPADDETSRALTLRLGGRPTGGFGWWWHTKDDTMEHIDEANLVRDCRIYVAVIHRLATAAVLPFGARAMADEWVEQLSRLQDAAGDRFDLGRALERARALQGLGAELDRRAAAASEVAATEAALNRCLIALQRLLVPVNYTVAGGFDHDPALPTPPIPALDPVKELAALDPESDAARFLITKLVRARNRVEFALGEAVRVAQETLAEVRS